MTHATTQMDHKLIMLSVQSATKEKKKRVCTV